MLGPRSKLVGKTLRDIGFRQQFGIIILTVHRFTDFIKAGVPLDILL